MTRLFKIPFAFLLIAAGIGLLLRWHFVVPMSWLNYSNWLHAHSHIMFLGWVGNFIMLAYLVNYSLWKQKRYRLLFYFIQGLLVGMLISFPIQGYGATSIILSALHITTWWLFTTWFFNDVKTIRSTSVWYAKLSLVLFVIASLGPFALGPLMVNGMGHSTWYYFAVYYYLHFQYNGFFIFGILSLWFHFQESNNISINGNLAIPCGKLLFVSLFPTYFLSTLWAKPGIWYNAIGLGGALTQFAAFTFFLLMLKHQKSHPRTSWLWTFSLISFGLKISLQLLSSHPYIAQLALETRSFVIAYLHLSAIGIVLVAQLAWCISAGIIQIRYKMWIFLLLISYIGCELLLVLSGITSVPHTPLFIFLLSAITFASFIMLARQVGHERE